LNDKIRIDNSYYNINQIIDYNPTVVGPTKVELISIDNELEFVPFKVRPVIGVGVIDSIANPIKDVGGGRTVLGSLSAAPGVLVLSGNGNTTSSSGTGVIIAGTKNTTAVKGLVFGDNNLMNSKSLILGDDNSVESSAMVLGNNNNIQPGIDNVLVIGNDITPTSDGLWADNINGVPTSSLISGLPGVLSIDPTTGLNPIILNAGSLSPIRSTSGNSNITMDAGIINTMQLSQVAGSASSNILFRPGSPAIGVRMQTINGSDNASMSVIATTARQTVTNGTDTSQTLLTATTYTINTPTTIIQQVPVTDNTNLKVLARNSVTGNVEEVDITSIPGTTPGLPAVLAVDNTTGGNNIVITSGDIIQSTDTFSTLNLDTNIAVLGVDAGLGWNSIVGLTDTIAVLAFNSVTDNSAVTLDGASVKLSVNGDVLVIEDSNINLPYVPTTLNTNTKLVTRNAATGDIELRDVSSLPTVLSSRLTAWDAYASNGIVVQTSTTTWVNRTITGPAAGITITNGDGIAGNPTLVLANDLAALEGLGSTGIAVRTATDTWAQRQVTAPAAGITITNPAGIAGNITLVLANDLNALENLASTGFAVRTATDTWAQRTITGTAGQITVTNGNGVSGNPTIALDAAALYNTIATISANATLANDTTLVNTASTTITVTLPTAVGIAGKMYTIKDKVGNASVRNITINTTSSQTIDGLLTYIITNAYESVTIISDGTSWFII